ncbi:MAG TPA: M56 family metallopeptidase [Mucilaginibacter sp.]|nr:M56 family metallopeptidase [Mucilaginibacter sp.]
MPALFTFLFKVNIALVLFCLGYYLVLRHLTFYTLNRIYLVAAILFSSIYPWINISGFVQRHQQLTAPIQNVIIQWKVPAEKLVQPFNQPNYWQWAEVIFWAGAILFALRLGMQLFSLYRLYRKSTPGQVNNYSVRLIDGDVSPFSFWRSIFVNPATLAPNDLAKVLEHEQVHVSQWHTLDILLAELSTVFYWFNPGIWLMKRAVRENIEFITDRKILQKGVDSKQYQYSLLNVSMAGTPNTIVNNFNISTIKKRIIMMNTKRSSPIKLSRYALVAPAVIALLLVFSISKADVAKKGLISIKSSLSAAIKSVAISSDDRPVMHPVASSEKSNILRKTKARTDASNADTIYKGKSKNGKKNMLITRDKSSDEINYIVNGAKSTKEEVKALDPDRVYSLDMMSATDAKKFVDFILDKPETLFVTTDDSETGKKLKDRINKDMRHDMLSHNYAASGVSADAAPEVSVGSGSSVSVIASSSSSDVAPAASASGVTAYGNSSGDQVVVYTTKVDPKKVKGAKGKVYVTAQPKIASASGDVIVTGKPATAPIYVEGKPVADRVYITGKPAPTGVYTLRSKNGEKDNVAYIYKSGADEVTIDGPGQKLFIVDGKETKNLKNIEQDDIQSITVLKNEAAEKLYGEKGKNGVIVITTNKGQK